jgi:endogenous inhibitor of DNA gyrase (YacG/DUF329 family)
MANPGDPNSITPMPAGAHHCPICGKRSSPQHQPFCSRRCANIDLGRWLKGSYRVEIEEPAEDGSEANEP